MTSLSDSLVIAPLWLPLRVRAPHDLTRMIASADHSIDDSPAVRDKTVVLMRGHGSVTVGTSIPQVVFRAYYAEMNARLQSQAIQLGAVTYLSAEEAAASAKTNDALVMRPWELWKRKAMKPE